MKTISIIQPHFIPWIGFFEIINKSDIFVFLNNVKYPYGKSFINRNNIIDIHNNIQWITVPIISKQKNLSIKDVKISNKFDRLAIQEIFKKNFINNKYFADTFFLLENILSYKTDSICDLNIYSTKLVCDYLGIKPEFFIASEILNNNKKKNHLLISIMQYFGKDLKYITGEGGRFYLDEKLFNNAGYQIKIINYNFKSKNNIIKNYNCSILQLLSYF